MQLEVMKELNDREMMNHKAVLDTAEEELNKIFDDVQLPEDEAWQKLTEDVRQSKADKWKLSTENAYVIHPFLIYWWLRISQCP
jgi:division protein CdvB (Snf7/Vps24/ESCRT-III family)